MKIRHSRNIGGGAYLSQSSFFKSLFKTSETGKAFRFGFTLAEVLITLGVIGVVAAMTIPALVSEHRDKVRITKLKKAYSTLSNAYITAVNQLGEVDDWNLPEYSYTSQEYASAIGKNLVTVIKTDKICDKKDLFLTCFTGGRETVNSNRGTFLDGTGGSGSAYYAFMAGGLVYGISPLFEDATSNPLQKRKIYASISVYLEPYIPAGSKNVYGKNIFSFLLTSKGIIPGGIGNYSDNLTNNTFPFDIYCVDASGKLKRGMGCTAWVLQNQNFDYLKCPEKLGWDKASSCKD